MCEMKNHQMTVLTGFRMESLKQHDRKKYDRINAMLMDGLKVKSDDVDFNSDLGKQPERVPFPWVCPAACRECPIENCTDRLDMGGKDAQQESTSSAR